MDKAKRDAHRKALKTLFRLYEPKVPETHEHEWYKAGELIHPRMGCSVTLYLCAMNHWTNKDNPCHAVSFEHGEHKYAFENFEKGYYYLQAP